jgi:hypothetical protein
VLAHTGGAGMGAATGLALGVMLAAGGRGEYAPCGSAGRNSRGMRRWAGSEVGWPAFFLRGTVVLYAGDCLANGQSGLGGRAIHVASQKRL